MTKKIIFLPMLFCGILALAQRPHIQEAISAHYKDFQKLSSLSNTSRAWMDTVQYPSAEYGNSLVYLLVKPYYLKEQEVKAISESVIFPQNSSDQTRKELDYLLDLQSTRTVEQKSRVEFLGNIGYWPSVNLLTTHPNYKYNLQDLFFEGREILGGWCNSDNFPAISKVLQGIMQDMRIMEFTIKYKLLRPRPYHLESKLQPLARISSPSFASGHTLWAFTQAYLWSEIIPEKREEFIKLAEELRRSREIMGIHFPSDNEAARQMAYKMIKAYFNNAEFKKDFQQALDEWRSQSSKYVK